MEFDLKKFLLIVIVFGIIFFVFGGMLKAQTSDQCDYVQRISFSELTFCEYRLKSDSTEMYDFYLLSRGSPTDTVKVVYYTKTATGCSIFRVYTTHSCVDNFPEYKKEKYPVIKSGMQATSELDIHMCFIMEEIVQKKISQIKKI